MLLLCKVGDSYFVSEVIENCFNDEDQYFVRGVGGKQICYLKELDQIWEIRGKPSLVVSVTTDYVTNQLAPIVDKNGKEIHVGDVIVYAEDLPDGDFEVFSGQVFRIESNSIHLERYVRSLHHHGICPTSVISKKMATKYWQII